jgi:Icc-related predicted phosphoesterase
VSLNILAIADQVSPVLYDRFDIERWRTVDMVLSCGDLPPEYLDFLCTMLGVPVFYVRGNHDAVYRSERFDGSENVHGRIVEHRGVRIAGFEGCHRYNGGRHQYTEAQMRRIVTRTRVKSIRAGAPHIILTHAPPFGCHDGRDSCHQGFAVFRTAIEAWKPKLFLHGHMHAYDRKQGEAIIGETRVINPYPFKLIELPERAPVAEAAVERAHAPGLTRPRATGIHG